MPKIFIENHNRTIDFNPAISLLNNFNMLQIPIGSQCGGRGNCGTCKYQVIEGKQFITPINGTERFRLTEEQLKNNWRLACQSFAIKDLKIYIPEPEKNTTV